MQLLLGSSVVLGDYLSSASDGTEKYREIFKNAFDSPVCVCRWCVVRAHLLFHVGDCIIADNSELEKEASFSISRGSHSGNMLLWISVPDAGSVHAAKQAEKKSKKSILIIMAIREEIV